MFKINKNNYMEYENWWLTVFKQQNIYYIMNLAVNVKMSNYWIGHISK